MTSADLLPKPQRPDQEAAETENLTDKFRRYCEENPGALECRIDDN